MDLAVSCVRLKSFAGKIQECRIDRGELVENHSKDIDGRSERESLGMKG